jgi:hypothetical protein
VEQQQHVVVASGGAQDTCATMEMFLEHYLTGSRRLMHRRPQVFTACAGIFMLKMEPSREPVPAGAGTMCQVVSKPKT